MELIEKLPGPEAIRADRTARSPFPVTFEPRDYAPDGPQRASKPILGLLSPQIKKIRNQDSCSQLVLTLPVSHPRSDSTRTGQPLLPLKTEFELRDGVPIPDP